MISVEKAVNKGLLIVNLPVAIVMLGTIGVFWYLAFTDRLPFYFALLSFLIAPVTGWIYWSFAITRWRIWAYTRVDNIPELLLQAELAQLIWTPGHFFEKTEIRTKKERALLEELAKNKFRTSAKQFEDDPQVPTETTIHFSKLYVSFKVIPAFGCIGFGIYLLITSDSLLLSLFLIASGGYLAFTHSKSFFTVMPQLVLNSQEIRIGQSGYRWPDIQEAIAIVEIMGSNSESILCISTHEEAIRHSIEDYDISVSELNHLLRIYEGRSQLYEPFQRK